MTDQAVIASAPGVIADTGITDTGLAPPRKKPTLLLAAAGWAAAAAITLLWPDVREFGSTTTDLAVAQALLAALLAAAFILHPVLRGLGRWLDRNAPWLVAIPVLLTIWQVASAKTGYWPQPYFPPPQSVVQVYFDDTARLLASIKASLILLGSGIVVGAGAGFVTGIATGWSSRVSYWTHPILRFMGPIPTTALIPIVLFLFPTSFSAGVFLIALATWFPVAVLTSSGVASVDTAYYDVARTLGANARFLLLRIAIPGSLPHVFVGLFMGLGQAIAILVVAEMIGVKDGLGYYLEWAQGWGAYGNLYAGLFIMAVLFSGLTTLLFRGRDRLLAWQQGVVKW